MSVNHELMMGGIGAELPAGSKVLGKGASGNAACDCKPFRAIICPAEGMKVPHY